MKPAEQTRFDGLYKKHLRALKLRGMSENTMDAYSRTVRRLAEYFECCLDRLSVEQLEAYFSARLEIGKASKIQCYFFILRLPSHFNTLKLLKSLPLEDLRVDP